MSVQDQIRLEDFGSIFSLEGKVAVVTGGSRGLGLHAASGYVERTLPSCLTCPTICDGYSVPLAAAIAVLFL